jgi:hypothetical protein
MKRGRSLAWLAPARVSLFATVCPLMAMAAEQQLVDVSMDSIVILLVVCKFELSYVSVDDYRCGYDR